MVSSINTNTPSNPNIKVSGIQVSQTLSVPSTAAETLATTSGSAKDTGSLSLLARQLSEASARAEARDKSLSRKELGEKVGQLTEQLVGSSYDANKARHDAETPDSDDPERMERAKNATQFVNGSGKNPFGGISREQLCVIAYDESGDFTVNEKKSAWLESYRQERVWRQQVVAKGSVEYSATGKLTDFYTSVLDHYKGLPAIEQSQYPTEYEAKLQSWIDQDFNYKTNTAGDNTDNKSFLDKVLNPESNIFTGQGTSGTHS